MGPLDRTRSDKPVKAGGKKKVVTSWEDEASDDDGLDDVGASARTDEKDHSGRSSGGGGGGTPSPYAEAGSTPALADDDKEPLRKVLAAFRMLQAEFDEKFKAMWA
jgi:hypothetical protein